MTKSNLLFIPAFGAGHLTSMLEFAKRLLSISAATSDTDISVTVLLIKPPSLSFSPTSLSYIQSIQSSLPQIHFHYLPELDLPENTDGPEDLISLYFKLYEPHLDSFVSSSPLPFTAMVTDFFATSLFDVAHKHTVPIYVYFASNALMLGLMLCLPKIDEQIPGEFWDYEGDVVVPGAVAFPAKSMPSPWMDRKKMCYKWFLYHGRRLLEAKGIVVNTVEEVEKNMLEAHRDGRFVDRGTVPTVYPVGPVLSLGGNEKGGECVDWLEKQPPRSVVFLCFGSNGSFSSGQVKEIAMGLEQSGHRFLWVIRVKVDGQIRQMTDENVDKVLPEGFLEKTKDHGLVWPKWAPQLEILSHPSVGGFVTHCGWNSTLESLWFGVPMLAWPLYAEQHLNEVEMVRDLGIAVGMKVDRRRDNFVAAEELERGVRSLMGESPEGEKVRARVAEMMTASRKAVEEGGSSYVNLKKLANDLSS